MFGCHGGEIGCQISPSKPDVQHARWLVLRLTSFSAITTTISITTPCNQSIKMNGTIHNTLTIASKIIKTREKITRKGL